MSILHGLLEKRGIEPIEAGGLRTPGENAFCVKICSKIITAQFCAVILNNEMQGTLELPNPNVNMEYGLMLGFNKYIIPFQRAEQKLPFNVAGLDTIKYTNADFESQASFAIDQAIKTTTTSGTEPIVVGQKLNAFLLLHDAVLARLDSEGDRAVFDLGSPLGFNLLASFSGTEYVFLGNFTNLRPEAVIWRLKILCRAIDARRTSWASRVKAGILTQTQADTAEELFGRFHVWVIVTSLDDRQIVLESLKGFKLGYETNVYSLADIDQELQALGGALA
jgi:hypothetical protein